MCGLVGYFGKWTFDRERTFRDMLRLDVLRGPHSTGVAFCVNLKDSPTKVLKGAILPDDLFRRQDYTKLTDKLYYDCYIGHNRFATTGSVIERNAHPFQHGVITGAHNGTLTYKYDLPEYGKFLVDSQIIFNSLDQHGLKVTYKQLRGAFALVWWDTTKPSLNFIRNKERPLFYTYTEDMSALLWASEAWMIQIACSRNKVKHGKIFTLGVNKHYEVTLSKGKDKKETIHVHIRKIKPFVPPKMISQGGWVAGLQGQRDLNDPYCEGYEHVDWQHQQEFNYPTQAGWQSGKETWDEYTDRRYRQTGERVGDHELCLTGRKAKKARKSIAEMYEVKHAAKIKRLTQQPTVAEITAAPIKNTIVPFLTDIGGDVKVNQFYSFYVKEVLHTSTSRLILSCNFQNIKDKFAKLICTQTKNRETADFLLSKTYDKLFFKAMVSQPITQNIDGKKVQYHIINGDSIEIIVPMDARRLCDGKYLTRKEFNLHYPMCGFCNEGIEFEDFALKFCNTDMGQKVVCEPCIKNNCGTVLI